MRAFMSAIALANKQMASVFEDGVGCFAHLLQELNRLSLLQMAGSQTYHRHNGLASVALLRL